MVRIRGTSEILEESRRINFWFVVLPMTCALLFFFGCAAYWTWQSNRPMTFEQLASSKCHIVHDGLRTYVYTDEGEAVAFVDTNTIDSTAKLVIDAGRPRLFRDYAAAMRKAARERGYQCR